MSEPKPEQQLRNKVAGGWMCEPGLVKKLLAELDTARAALDIAQRNAKWIGDELVRQEAAPSATPDATTGALPCPFCGTPASIVDETPEGDCQVFCGPCDVKEPIWTNVHAIGPKDKLAETIAAWNSRAALSGSPDEPASPECDGRCCDTAAVVRAFVQRVNARAEADMLAGNPVTGAHHRAIEVEVAALSTPALASPDEPRATEIREAEIRGATWVFESLYSWSFNAKWTPATKPINTREGAERIVDAARSPHEGPTNG